MSKKVEFVYFDLGNVIVHFDHSKMGENLSSLTELSSAEAYRLAFDSGLQFQYESGQISTEELVTEFNQQANSGLTTDQFCDAISDIFWLNRPIVPLLAQLSLAGVPMAVLSNTCVAHWEFVLGKFPIIASFFENSKNILSYQCKSMKPDDKIYQTAIEMAGVHPEKIFFTDDREDNVAGAQRNGIHCLPFKNVFDLANQLQRGGITINL